ncbi:hypothetical protein BJV78DRAFT_1158923 [Lactifluus subvellereus]|nr:hypothetical protein BJV78DRAFT_1158923 [Lactifluus subvellereus]
MSGGPRAKGLWEFRGVREGAHKRCGLRMGGGLVVWFSPDNREFGNAQRSTVKDGGRYINELKLEPSTSYVPLDPAFGPLPIHHRPPFDALTNTSGSIPKARIPSTALGKKRAIFCKKGTKLARQYHAQWDGYYTLYDGRVYPLVYTNDIFYTFQKQWNDETEAYEGG